MSDEPTSSHSPSSGQDAGAPPPRIPDHELLRCIGQGSYGQVWLARNVMGEWRAVKVVYRLRFAGDEHLYEREFEGIRRYEPISRSHESLVPVLHVGRDEAAGCFYYVMELADDAADGSEEVRERGSEPIAAPAHSLTPPLPRSPSAYSPRTLRSELKKRKRLPPEECVRIGAALATALQQLHSHKLVHRDIKPSNIIFVDGRAKLADIGLVTDLDASRSFVGTMGYVPMEGPGQPSADLYALGKVLYEMVTGRDRFDFPSLPSFAGLDEREQQGVRELNAVLLKACAEDPKQRHRGAGELRDELLRLQLGESIERSRSLERAYGRLKVLSRWVGAALLLSAVLFGVWSYRGRAALREAWLREAALSRAGGHEAGWSTDNLTLIQRAAALGAGPDVLTEAAGALAGLDARLMVTHRDLSGGSAAFASDGAVLVGGASGSNACLMTTNGAPQLFSTRAEGPVCWSAEGVALQFSEESNSVVLCEVASKRLRRAFPLAEGEHVTRFVGPALALTPDGRRVAAAVARGERGRVVTWDSATGGLLGEANWDAVALALSADGSVLVAGDANGNARIGSLPGLTNALTLPPPKPGPILCLALTRHRVAPEAASGRTNGWLLAVAYKGGEVIIWDLGTGQRHAFCRGSSWTVTALTFDADGLTLASAGRGEARLWDVTSGRQLLSLHGGGSGNARALAFSADSRRLLWGSEGKEERPCVSVFELSWHRGIQVLRGLKMNAHGVWFSPDSRRLAALSDDWIVAVWDTASGRLVSMFEAPTGIYADSAGGVFDKSGQQFAFAAGVEARLFDVETGQVRQVWRLGAGLMDQLQFDKHGRLWLLRRSPDTIPVSPQRWRLEELRLDGVVAQLHEQTNKAWAAYTTGFPPGAQRFFIGTQDKKGQRPDLLVFDANSGQESKKWTLPGLTDATPRFDPSGTWFFFPTNPQGRGEWGSLADLEPLGSTPERCAALGPTAGLFALQDRRGYVVRDKPGLHPDLPLGQDWVPTSGGSFSPDGRFFAWGSAEGPVLAADLDEVRRRFNALVKLTQ